MAKRSGRVPYNVLNNISSVDTLYEEARPSKKRKGRILGVYQAERLIARRRDAEGNKYLVKWKGYSSFENTWEPEEHISAVSLRYFEKPEPSEDVVQDCIDLLRREVLDALRHKGPMQRICVPFRHDVFHFLFDGLGSVAEQRQWTLYDAKDFLRCQLPDNWNCFFNNLGDGVKIRFPVKMRIFLGRSAKNFKQSGEQIPQCYVEKLTFYFIKVPHGSNQ